MGNTKLNSHILRTFAEVLCKYEVPTLPAICQMTLRKLTSKTTLLDFLSHVCQEAEKQGKKRKALNIVSLQKSLTRFMNERNFEEMAIGDVDAGFINDYKTWLQEKQLANNTSSQYLHDLRSSLKGASEKGVWHNETSLDKLFQGLMKANVCKTEKPFVPQELISQMWSLNIEDALAPTARGDGKILERNIKKVSFARDCFVFCFCSQGMDFLDMGRLKKENVIDGHIKYVRKKTDKKVTVEILPIMQEIMNRHKTKGKYLFPVIESENKKDPEQNIISAQRQYNKRLAMLAKLLGDDIKLTSQMPVYSWAVAAYRNGMAISKISEAMGYNSDFALRDFLLSLDEKEESNDTNKKIINNIFG